jgi:hypothetical protein
MPKNLPKTDVSTTPKVPTYRQHKASGQALVTLSGRDIYLGPFGSPESEERYHQAIGQWLAVGAASWSPRCPRRA